MVVDALVPRHGGNRHNLEARLSEAEAWAAECVSLPCFPEMTDGQTEVVCRALR